MDVKVVEKWLERYPKLANFMDAGTISLKMAREIIDVDRWFMYDIFKELIEARAVTASGSNSWRATKELKDYLKQRREQERSAHAND